MNGKKPIQASSPLVSLEVSISLLGSSLKTLSQSYFATHQT